MLTLITLVTGQQVLSLPLAPRKHRSQWSQLLVSADAHLLVLRDAYQFHRVNIVGVITDIHDLVGTDRPCVND